MKFTTFLLIASLTVGAPLHAGAQDRLTAQPPAVTVAWKTAPGAVQLASGESATPIVVDEHDIQPTGIAANLLADDVQRVIGRRPKVIHGLAALQASDAVLVGTIGHSSVIDPLVSGGKINVDTIRGKWETFLIRVVDHPTPGIARALVIAGSDRRGTAYGALTLSQAIGVSPWYWWANVPVAHHDTLYVLPADCTQGPPSVKYRGIFINDEAPAMSGWTHQEYGGFNSKMYVHVFELLLRLKANFLWPAMWGSAFNEDDPQNPKLANEWGIVMSTSHQEPMMRAQGEFDRRYRPDEWNFATHPQLMEQFWREGIRRNKDYENVITIGMRGRNDSEMIKGATIDQSIALLRKIIDVQRKIIAQEVNPDVAAVPQLWCPYKEVLSYYDHGMRVPDDVTLLWTDDNVGNIRRLPTPEERKRSGGAGIYYHFDYVGGPRDYKWINTNYIPKIWEQMTLAKAYGADRIWVVNVGDLKPMELPISFFMSLAWNTPAMTAQRMADYSRQWLARQFGDEHAAEMARLVDWYTLMNSRRKPELLDNLVYSPTDYLEGDTIIQQCRDAIAKAGALETLVPSNARDGYFELVAHPTEATATVNELYALTGVNHLYAKQGRAATNRIADEVADCFKRDAALSNRYNHEIDHGFWNHMMDQVHLGYSSWSDPRRNSMPPLNRLQIPQAAAMGIAVDGTSDSWPAFEPDGSSSEGDKTIPTLPTFDSLNRDSHYIDIFNRGRSTFTYTATANQPWITIDRPAGEVGEQQRVQVSIDWAKLATGPSAAEGTVSIAASAGGAPVVVRVRAINPASPTPATLNGFAADDGVVAILPAHYSKKIDTAADRWTLIPNGGRAGDAMMTGPRTAASIDPHSSTDAPCLQYQVYLPEPATVSVRLTLSPTRNFVPGRGLRYAIGFDDQTPQEIDSNANPDRDWYLSAINNYRVSKSSHQLNDAGYHTLKLWMVDPALVIQQIAIDMGGRRPSYLGPPESVHRLTQN